MNTFEERLLLDDCYYLSGEIPRITSFERGRPDHLTRKGPDQAWEPDPLLMDERYLAVSVRDKGLIVLSACSHAGVVNVLLDAREVFPDTPVYGVFGGLHLVGQALEGIIPDTVTNLQKLAPQANHARPLHGMARAACSPQCLWGKRHHAFGGRQPLQLLE